MNILLTGASGFLGRELAKRLAPKATRLFVLTHNKPVDIPGAEPIPGDITEYGLGIQKCPLIHAVVHAAALLSFREERRQELTTVNCDGTWNVIEFMRYRHIRRLFHISTAYIAGRWKGTWTEEDFDRKQGFHNPYEMSKHWAEQWVREAARGSILHEPLMATIFRPGILIGDSALEAPPAPEGFYKVIIAINRAKQYMEEKLSLPPLKLTLGVPGDPQGTVNLIPVDIAAEWITRLMEMDCPGTFHITNPHPPTTRWLQGPVSEALGINLEVGIEGEPNLAERFFIRMAERYLPYFEGGPEFDMVNTNRALGSPSFELTEEFMVKSLRTFFKAQAAVR